MLLVLSCVLLAAVVGVLLMLRLRVAAQAVVHVRMLLLLSGMVVWLRQPRPPICLVHHMVDHLLSQVPILAHVAHAVETAAAAAAAAAPAFPLLLLLLLLLWLLLLLLLVLLLLLLALSMELVKLR